MKQINLEEHSRLDKNQNRFRKRSEDVEELRRRIELLSARVSHKKQSDSNHQRDNDTQIHSPANPNQPVASVGPFFKPNQQQVCFYHLLIWKFFFQFANSFKQLFQIFIM